MFFSIFPENLIRGKVFVSNDFYSKCIFDNTDINIQVGLRKKKARLVLLPELEKNVIMISKDVLEYLSIPLDLPYQIKCTDDGIKIGPVIGLLAAKKAKNLTEEYLNELTKHALLYSQTGGILYAFSLEGIDFKKELIKGYYFNPNGNRANAGWEEGIFPFPGATFRRIYLSYKMETKLAHAMQNRMFNSYYFDKWELWKMASCKSTRDYLPETRLLSSINDVDEMLNKYDSLYLKPVIGSYGTGIVRVSKASNGYCFHRKYGKPFSFTTKEEAQEYLESLKLKHRYLIQQDVKALYFEGRHTAFRVIMQKNETKKWQCTRIACVLGKPGGNCSNYDLREGVLALSFENFFERFLPLNEEKGALKKLEIIKACKNICELIDATGGNYGDLGFDVVLDKSLKVWILEVNKRQGFQALSALHDEHAMREFNTCPIKYAAALDGFLVLSRAEP